MYSLLHINILKWAFIGEVLWVKDSQRGCLFNVYKADCNIFTGLPRHFIRYCPLEGQPGRDFMAFCPLSGPLEASLLCFISWKDIQECPLSDFYPLLSTQLRAFYHTFPWNGMQDGSLPCLWDRFGVAKQQFVTGSTLSDRKSRWHGEHTVYTVFCPVFKMITCLLWKKSVALT